ncbi:MAG: sigma-54 dependent transcriptional regulator [Thermincola sp.]|jgi:two-component system response regulator AtoC|nr:sigma-54 dependent transcriptional regulator [Thermincola sp.]MDT3702844.1 sigma-54 dependent transcriptional regulator [Thermincola sp.]
MSSRRKPIILVVDDEPDMGWLFEESLGEKYCILSATSWSEGETFLNKEKPDLVVLDLCMEGVGGLDALKMIRKNSLDMPVLMITAYATIQNAVEAMKCGAYDYVVKPFNIEQMEKSIEEILANTKYGSGREFAEVEKDSNIIYTSLQMQQVVEIVRKAARSNANVMLLGESGTGKELLANEIHRCSNRADGSFVVINCAAVPDNLLESELFGYEKGAFTGAASRKAGKLELANGGTLFLDELGDMPLLLQGKLLRALEQRQIERLGGIKPIEINIRIVSATNRDLEKLIAECRFRSDLYYRLAVIPVSIPPLRERTEDINILVKRFLANFNQLHNKNISGFSPEALKVLNQYKWPGNVRELRNVIEMAVVLHDGPNLEPQHLSLKEKDCSFNWSKRKSELFSDIERREICSALKLFEGNRTKAARYLSMSTRNLLLKIKKLEISSDDYAASE